MDVIYIYICHRCIYIYRYIEYSKESESALRKFGHPQYDIITYINWFSCWKKQHSELMGCEAAKG